MDDEEYGEPVIADRFAFGAHGDQYLILDCLIKCKPTLLYLRQEVTLAQNCPELRMKGKRVDTSRTRE